MDGLQSFIYKIKKGQIFFRVENDIAKRFDNPKFYSYFRKIGCDVKLWKFRCQNYCKFMKLEALQDLNLLNVPYKTVYFVEDVTENDEILANTLKKLALQTYSDQNKITCLFDAIDNLILLQSSKINCGNSDWVLANFLCDLNLDGMVRFPEGAEVNCFDEVAICNPDNKVKVLEEEMLV